MLFENFCRARKSMCKAVYCSIPNEISVESKEIFYTIFSTFLIIVVLKDIKLHRSNLLSKSKYYKKMLKHSLATKFLQIIFYFSSTSTC